MDLLQEPHTFQEPGPRVAPASQPVDLHGGVVAGRGLLQGGQRVQVGADVPVAQAPGALLQDAQESEMQMAQRSTSCLVHLRLQHPGARSRQKRGQPGPSHLALSLIHISEPTRLALI
eukprot:8047723-Alexandrium_andersonii.AAC.1